MFVVTKSSPCPASTLGDRFSKKPDKRGTVKSLEDFVEGRSYVLHACWPVEPPVEISGYYDVRAKHTHIVTTVTFKEFVFYDGRCVSVIVTLSNGEEYRIKTEWLGFVPWAKKQYLHETYFTPA